MKRLFVILLAVGSLLAACHRQPQIDPLARSRADGLNRQAFLLRYRNPDSCKVLADSALRFIRDSLPQYVDGTLRARNIMAFACYQMSNREGALAQLDQVDRLVADPLAANGDIELVIANLLRARLLQRDCRIADSYRLLYDISSRHTLDRSRDNLLYNYAQTEYYITSLVLNFHYREGHQADVRQLISEVEQNRPNLRVDYAQDMALDYALAYAWQSAGESLTALDYCNRTLDWLDANPSQFCIYHYANALQMSALALRGLPGEVPPDSVLSLYDQARRAFFRYGDPYQMLGGTVSTARFALLCGDTAVAHSVLDEWRSLRGTWTPFAAPKMELGYFDVLLRSRIADSPDQARRWYEHHEELQERVRQYEKEDFVLQQTLQTATRRSQWMTRTTILVSLLLLALLVVTLLLWRSLIRLRQEKRQLEAAKRRDVERIANVETCLSVLRHDVSPFIGYLASPSLSPELRDEVTGQLVRTFDNIKNWTRLSIPTGLAFSPSQFPLQQVFDDVRSQVVRPSSGVTLLFQPTHASLWADRLLATILLRNLVTNALQHTVHGSVAVAASPAADDMVEITVSDTGTGMTRQQVDALFRADRQLQGEHGFGLILCRYIIKKHDDLTRRGCRIWVESTENQGTTIHVLLSASKKQ